MIVCSYLPPRWPAAVSGWWGSHGVPQQWLKLFSWRFFLLHMQWGWMQEPVDLRYSQRQQRRACQGTYAQKEAQLSCLTSRPCWHWQILTTVRCSWKPLWVTVINRMIVSERKEKCRLYKSLKRRVSTSIFASYPEIVKLFIYISENWKSINLNCI